MEMGGKLCLGINPEKEVTRQPTPKVLGIYQKTKEEPLLLKEVLLLTPSILKTEKTPV